MQSEPEGIALRRKTNLFKKNLCERRKDKERTWEYEELSEEDAFYSSVFSDKDGDDDNKDVFIVFRMGDILVCL